jgi:hypothetical protein
MDADIRHQAREDLEQRRQALHGELDRVYREIARTEKRLLRLDRQQAALAERRRRPG